MVAEAIPVSTEETKAPSAPEATPQSAQPTPTEPESTAVETPSEEEDDSSFDALLKEHGFTTEDGNGETTESPSSTASPTPEIKTLSPEEAYQRGQADTQQSLLRAQEEYQRTAREQGTINAFIGARDNRVRDMQAQGYPVDMVNAVYNDWNQAYGQIATVVQAGIREANEEYKNSVAKGLYDVAADIIGPDFPARQSEHFKAPNVTKALLEDFAKSYAAKNKLLTPAEAKKQTADEVKAFIKKLPVEARTALGWKPSSTNSTNVSGTGSGKLTKELAESLPVSELIKRQAR